MLTDIHQFRLPETIIFGWGAVERVGEEARRFGQRALLVSGGSATRDIRQRVAGALSAAGVSVAVFDGISPEPSSAAVDAAVSAIRDSRCDVVVGVGGGSPLDTAKAAAGVACLDGPFLEYLRGKPIERAGVPLIALPTTSGTAAEITKNAVFLDEERQVKIGARSDFWFPKVAIVDPSLTMGMPPALTAASGLDALSHAQESLVSLRAHAVSETLSERSISLVGRSLRAAVTDGSDRQAREDMAMASMIAGMAFANVGCGAAHALAHVIGPAFGLSHGASCGLLMPYVLAFNLPACQPKAARLATLLGVPGDPSPEDAVTALLTLLADLQMPASLADVGAKEADLSALIAGAMLSGARHTNPLPVAEAELLAILRAAHRGRPSQQ